MTAFLLFLLLFTLTIILGPVALQGLGLNLDPWLLNAIAAFIGSLVAIIGSIVITLLTDRKKRRKAYERELNLLKLELYNNFILGIHLFLGKKDIDFDIKTFENFIQFISGKEENQYADFTKELQVLYFTISYGKKILTDFSTFKDLVFKKEHKKPKGVIDMYEIIQSKSVESVYEFSVIKGIIMLNENFNLNINLPFNMYKKLLDEFDATLSIKERIVFYLIGNCI